MALPKQAQEQVDEANRILAAMHPEKAAEKEGEDPNLKLVDTPKPTDQPSAEQPEADQPTAEQPVAEQPVAEQPAPEKTKVEKEKPNSDNWEFKYGVLRGKYDSEVPRLHKQVQALTRELEQLRQVKEEETQPQMSAAASLVTDEEVEEYGPELIDLIGRKAREISQSELTKLQNEISTLKSTLSGVTQEVGETSREKLISKLDTTVKDWREVNTQAEFLDWLDEVDPFSGNIRGQMLKTAYENNDAERVVAFFTGFQKEYAAITPQQADPLPAKSTPAAAVDLNDLVAPGKTARNTAPASAQNAERVWTRKQITEFYSEVNKGKYKSDPAMKAAIEREIINAVSSNRIRD